MADNFSVWLFRERYWSEGDAGRRIGADFTEPAEAADFAEERLDRLGVAGQSYCEIRFNGDAKPHSVICLLATEPWPRYGVWNTEISQWPIFYPPGEHGDMLSEFPFSDADDGAKWKEVDESDKKAKSDDEGDMKLDEIEDDGMEEDEDGDERAEDEEVSEDDFTEKDEDGDDEADSDEGDNEEEPEEEDGTPDEDEDDDAGEEDSEPADEDAEEEGEDENSEDEGNEKSGDESEAEDDLDDDEDDEEEEIEMPRLGIFAKFRGPLGWRKRADAEELQEKNTFALKLGILDSEGEKPKDQEREVFAEFQFIESDDDREAGILRMKLPEGVEFSDPTKAGWVTARIPYRSKEG